MTDYLIRKASLRDISFLVEAIIGAEKSGTERCGLALLFNLTEGQLKKVLTSILEEDVDGCEYSLSSFYVVEDQKQKLCAALSAWVEMENEDGAESAFLKSNLLNYYIPKENIKIGFDRANIINDIQIKRTPGVIQIENVYVAKDSRGKGLLHLLLSGVASDYDRSLMDTQVFGNNEAALKAYDKLGFKEIQRYTSSQVETMKYLPYWTKILLEKQIIR